MLSNCSEMLILGTNWTTRYSMVSEQTCTIDYKMDKACDKRLNRLMSYIHHTCEYKQHCFVGNTAKQCRLRFCRRSSGGTLCVFGSHTFVPISWMCKETNISVTQFNRIRNHLFGCRIKVRWYIRACLVGSDRCSSWKHESEP